MQVQLVLTDPFSPAEYDIAQRLLNSYYRVNSGATVLPSALSVDDIKCLKDEWNAVKGQSATVHVPAAAGETLLSSPALPSQPLEMSPDSPLIFHAQPRAQVVAADIARAAEAALLAEAAAGVVAATGPRRRRTKAEMDAARAAEAAKAAAIAALPPTPRPPAGDLAAALTGNFETVTPQVQTATTSVPQSPVADTVQSGDELLGGLIPGTTQAPAGTVVIEAPTTPATPEAPGAGADDTDFTTWPLDRLHDHIKSLVSTPAHGPKWLRDQVLIPYGASNITALTEDQARAVCEQDFLDSACA